MQRRKLGEPQPSSETSSSDTQPDRNDLSRSRSGQLASWCDGWRVLAALAAFRACSAALCQTAFVPDEYWQSLEVAHRIVFGYGYLTWEWREAIRGYTHPLLFASLYKTLAILHLDHPRLLVELPKVMNAVLAVVCDVYVCKLASLLHGPRAGSLALLVNVSSWFLFYCLPRSLANSLETVMVAPLLYHWARVLGHTEPQHKRRSTAVYLVLSAVSVLVRPTAAIVSVPLVVAHLWSRPNDRRMLLQYCTAIGLITLLWSVSIDSYLYQKPVLVQWNFFVFNVLEGQSAAYGTHPWHWYFTQGVPVVLFTSLPLCLLGAWQTPSSSGRGLAVLGVWAVLVHSLLAHKEFRFIMPVLPIASVLSGHALDEVLKKSRVVRWGSWALLLANIPMAMWFSLVHQRGTLDVMTYLQSNVNENSSVLFLMPCHSTPFYSHIHRNITMEFLECPPQLDASYVDVETEFYSSPEAWLNRRYHQTKDTASSPPLPTHLVMFDTLIQDMERFLKSNGYRETTRLFHTLHPLESDVGTHVVVWSLT